MKEHLALHHHSHVPREGSLSAYSMQCTTKVLLCTTVVMGPGCTEDVLRTLSVPV